MKPSTLNAGSNDIRSPKEIETTPGLSGMWQMTRSNDIRSPKEIETRLSFGMIPALTVPMTLDLQRRLKLEKDN